jgi:hypothetical protein
MTPQFFLLVLALQTGGGLPPPCIEDLVHFHLYSHELCKSAMRLACGYEQHLFSRRAWEGDRNYDLWTAVICENDRYNYRAWMALAAATNPGSEPYRCREALGELRSLIGPRAFYRGEMPPPIPLLYLRSTHE